MQMVGHEAVGKICKLFVFRGAQNLLCRDVDSSVIFKDSLALVRAKRQEISIQTSVIERAEMTGIARDHDRRAGKKRARDGPPKGGRHD